MNKSPSAPAIKAGTIHPVPNPYAVPGGYTRVSNAIFDRAMPALSANGFKILLVVLRQTWGYADPASPTGRRQFDRISYSQLREKSGIKSDTTIWRALQECLDAGWLVRKRVGTDSRSGKPLYAYAVNTPGEASTPITGQSSTSEKRVPGTSEIGDTTGKENKNGGAEAARVLSLLKEFHVTLDGEVRDLAARYSLQQIEHGIRRAVQQGQRNPQGLLRCWMRAGHMPAPPPKEQRYAADRSDPHELNADARAFAAYRAAPQAGPDRPAGPDPPADRERV